MSNDLIWASTEEYVLQAERSQKNPIEWDVLIIPTDGDVLRYQGLTMQSLLAHLVAFLRGDGPAEER